MALGWQRRPFARRSSTRFDDEMRSILVVDSQQEDARRLTEALINWGHRVCLAYDGESALELVTADVPDVIVSDVVLKHISGYDVARAVRGRFGRAVRLVALTDQVGRRERVRAWAAGFDAFIGKPYRLGQIERHVYSPPVPRGVTLRI